MFGYFDFDVGNFVIKQLTNRVSLLIKSKIDILPSAHLKLGKPVGWIAKFFFYFGIFMFHLHKGNDEIVCIKLSDENKILGL